MTCVGSFSSAVRHLILIKYVPICMYVTSEKKNLEKKKNRTNDCQNKAFKFLKYNVNGKKNFDFIKNIIYARFYNESKNVLFFLNI